MISEMYYLGAIVVFIIITIWREASWRTVIKNDMAHLEKELNEVKKQVTVLVTKLVEKGLN